MCCTIIVIIMPIREDEWSCLRCIIVRLNALHRDSALHRELQMERHSTSSARALKTVFYVSFSGLNQSITFLLMEKMNQHFNLLPFPFRNITTFQSINHLHINILSKSFVPKISTECIPVTSTRHVCFRQTSLIFSDWSKSRGKE